MLAATLCLGQSAHLQYNIVVCLNLMHTKVGDSMCVGEKAFGIWIASPLFPSIFGI